MPDPLTLILRCAPPESAHRASISLLRMASPFLPQPAADPPVLGISVLGLTFPNPIGLAAGYDKNAEVPDGAMKLGFGFAEVGTVTPRPQPGNPRPRLFRLREDRAVINRMGFNNAGQEALAQRLASRPKRGILGINIGANKDSSDRIADYRAGFQRLAGLADYVTVNVSSPNTPGLRGLQNRSELERLLSLLVAERQRLGHTTPLLLKIAPDIDAGAMDDIAGVCLESGIDGLIITNTTIGRPPSLRSPHASETGGLSGAPLFEPSTQVLKAMRTRLGRRLVLIGVGGIASGADAYAKIRAGASLVQLYTALVYEGPGLVTRIKRELGELLTRDGFARVEDAVGSDVS
jgi:dihydroorotate dehydrogenase